MGMVAEVCDAVWIWLMARYDDHADHWIELILNILACREGKRKRERKSTIGH
jgi:predicted kinase